MANDKEYASGFTSIPDTQRYEELRDLLELKGFKAVASGAKNPLHRILDSKNREWRAHGKRTSKHYHGGSTPEIRMTKNGTLKRGDSIWVKNTIYNEPGILPNGSFKNIKKMTYDSVSSDELSYSDSIDFIGKCL